jgi:hypothetical protein
MATRKTATKAPAAKAARPAAKAEGKSVTKAPARTAPAAAKTSRAAVAAKPAVAPAPAEAPKKARPLEVPSGEARYRWIARAAYLRAERRGFAPGQEIDDWLAAEAEFLAIHGIG